MRRVYGYKRRNFASGKRYQDGQDAQARSDKDIVITKEAIKGDTFFEPNEDEEIELKPAAAVTVVEKSIARESTESSVDTPVEPKLPEDVKEKEEQVGELPDHMTGFMPTDNVKPTVGETTPEEADPEAE